MYKQITAEILKIDYEEEIDIWKEKAEAPLFSRKIYNDYQEGITEKDVISLKIDTRDAQSRTPFNALVSASTGVGKTRLIKNIIKGFYKQGTKILYFEPKGFETVNAKHMGIGKKLAPGDKNEKLNVVSYVPNYCKSYLEKNLPHVVKKVKFYSPKIASLDYVEIWQSFGFPTRIASFIVEMIRKGHTSLEYFEKHIGYKNMHHATSQSSASAFDALRASSFFGGKELKLEEEWAKGNIVVINYFSRDGIFMNTDVGLVLDLLRDIGLRESKEGLDKVTKKLVVLDDIFYYAGLSATLATRSAGGSVNLAIRNISNCQNNFRTWGIDTMIVVQSPDSNAVFPSLIDGCTTKFISYTENPTALSNKIPYPAYQLISNTDPEKPMLYVDEDNYTFQWIFCQGKTKWVTGFPFDCSVGHAY